MTFDIVIGLLIFCSLFVGFFMLGEFITYKFPNTKFETWWRKNFIEENNDID
jgi:hypothetical protein